MDKKVIVIGGGVAGLSIGWRLAEAGAQVTLLERGEIGRGATWAAAGMIAVAAEMGNADTPEAGLARNARDLWPDFARDVERASGLSVDYRQNGSLIVAMNAESVKPLAARAITDREVSWVDAEHARKLEPLLAPDVAGALWAPDEAQVDPRKLVTALRAAFEKAGGTIKSDEEVLKIESEHSTVSAARTASGLHKADAFVLAAGAWSGVLEARLPIAPIKGEIIVLAPPPRAKIPEHVVWGDGVYVVPRGDRLIAGATMEDIGFDLSATPEAAESLFARAFRLMPALKDWTIANQFVGLRPRSPDFLPLIGPTGFSNLFAATGQFRNGILFAPSIAELMCRFVLERPVSAPSFDPRRFT